MATAFNANGTRKSFPDATPRQAVVMAHALAHHDRDAASYEERYGKLVRDGERMVTCGNWSANKPWNHK